MPGPVRIQLSVKPGGVLRNLHSPNGKPNLRKEDRAPLKVPEQKKQMRNPMITGLKWLFLLLSVSSLFAAPCAASDHTADDGVVRITEFTYHAGKGDSREISRSLALFGARIKAVRISAKYLMHKGILRHYGTRQNEIFCLATNTLKETIIAERFSEKGAAYFVKIQTEAKSTDFIQAEIRDLELEKAEARFSYDEEMEQFVSKTVNPGEELSRAYRYIRQGNWRIAVIYLDHLSKKYPYWSELYMAKAIGYYCLHDGTRMAESLRIACSLGSQEACDDLVSLAKDPENPLKLN